jgi:flagellar assembly protein FliH
MPQSNNVIRSEDLKGGQPVAFNFQDIQAIAKKILSNANAQSQRTLEAARQQAQDIEKSAHEDGHKKGFEEGRKQGLEEGRREGEQAGREQIAEETRTLAETLDEIIQDLANHRLERQNAAEVDLLQLAMAIARKVIRRSLEVEDVVLRTVEAAVELTVERHDIVLHVAPEDLAAAKEHLPHLHARFNDLRGISVEEDPEVSRGGVRAVTRQGEVDLRIEEQLASIERALLGGAVDEEGPFASPPAEIETGQEPGATSHEDSEQESGTDDEAPSGATE